MNCAPKVKSREQVEVLMECFDCPHCGKPEMVDSRFENFGPREFEADCPSCGKVVIICEELP